MTAPYRTLYQCTKCQGVLDLVSDTLESASCACGNIKITQSVRTSPGEKHTAVYVKHRDVQPIQKSEPGPYKRVALA